jgi:hypothetical protein
MNNKLIQLKQRLQFVHINIGITISLLMYITIFFGIFAIFLPYISVWEKPSRHFEAANIKDINYSIMVNPVISDPEFPRNNIIIELPGYKNDPALKVRHQFVEASVFNPTTMQKINDEKGQSELALFLNTMHYGRPLIDFGYIVFGLMAIGVLFLIIGGLIQVSLIKYKNKVKNNQGKFGKWHREIFTWLCAPLIIVTMTGALMNIGYEILSPITYFSSNGETIQIKKFIRPLINPSRESINKNFDTVDMLPINELIIKAQQINPEVTFHKLKLIHWKDSNAQIELEGYNPKMPFLNGIYNNPTVILSAVDGSLIENIKVLDVHWSKILLDCMYFLHLLFGVDIFIRIITAIIMITCAFAISFAILLFLSKKSKKFNKDVPFYHWFEKLSISVIIGIIPATGFIFLLQWILPFDMQDRLLWQKGLFLIFWLSTLTWSFYRISSHKAVKELILVGSLLFITTPFIHFYSTNFSPFDLYEKNMNIILNVNIALFLLGVVLLYIFFKIPKKTQKVKLISNHNKGLNNE